MTFKKMLSARAKECQSTLFFCNTALLQRFLSDRSDWSDMSDNALVAKNLKQQQLFGLFFHFFHAFAV